MERNVLNTNLTGKVAVVTGAGGVLCSDFANVLARAGAKVALLNRTVEKAQKYADEINAEGGIAKAYACNVLKKEDCEAAAQAVLSDFGPCDILVNGAGGNHPKATTDTEYLNIEDIDGEVKTFFDLDESGVEMVFNLNSIGTLLPTQAFARQMVGRGGNVINISSTKELQREVDYYRAQCIAAKLLSNRMITKEQYFYNRRGYRNALLRG